MTEEVTIIFPEELGNPLLNGWSDTPANNVFRTSMEEGPPKTRRWGTAGVGAITASYIWNRTQRSVWKLFYENSIASGALSFKWVHPIDNVYKKVRVKNVPSESLVSWDYFSYNLELEVLPYKE